MAVEVGGIYFSAELDDAPLKQSIKQIENNIRLMSGSVSSNVNKSADSFKNLTKETEKLNVPLKETSIAFKNISQSVASIGLTALAANVVNTTAKFEKYEAVLTNTYQSSDKAKKSFAFIKEFAASTPFSVDELTASFIKFLNRGLEPTKESLTAFGDIAASQGKSFDQFTEAVLDATSGEFERLKEFGISASKAGDQVSLSFKGQTLSIRNTKEEIEKALISFGKMPGVADSMASVSKTTEGAFSNLGDAMDSLKVALGNVFLPLVKSITIGLASIVTSIKDFIEGMSPLGTGILRASGIMAAFLVTVNGLSAAIAALGLSSTSAGLAMSAAFGPAGIIIAGIAASFYAITKAMEDSKKASDETAATMATMGALFSKDGIKNAREFALELTLMSVRAEQIGDVTQAFSELSPKLEDVRLLAKKLNIDFKDFVTITGNTFTVNRGALDGFINKLKEVEQATKKAKISAPSKAGATGKGDEIKYVSDLDRAYKSLSETLKKRSVESSQSFGQLGDAALSTRKSFNEFKDAVNSGNWVTAINKGAQSAQQALAMVGDSFVKLFQAQAQLAQVKLTNLTNKVDFAANAIIYAYDLQQDALLAGIDNEMAAIQDQKDALLAVERQYLVDLELMRAEFSQTAKDENDAAYNAEVERLEADYQKKLEYLQANTADEEQFAIQKALLQQDLDAAKINLRQVFDEKLLETIKINDKKIDEQQAVRAASQLEQVETLDEKKTQLEQKRINHEKNAEQQKQDLIKKTEMFKWAAGFNAFQMDQKAKLAQARMSLAMGVLDVIRASVSFLPFSLGLLGFLPLIASAGATSIAAIQATQYPPPPMFAEGGIVGGNSFTGDKVDAKVNSGEMILTTSQQAQLFEMANGKNGGATTNIYLGGVKVESMGGSVDMIAERVSNIIRKDVYMAYGGLPA